MKNCFFSCLFCLLLAASHAEGNRLNAYFTYAAFDVPDGKPYLETYLQVGGPSVTFAILPDGRYQGTLDIKWVFRKNDKIVSFDKYLLRSPVMDSLALMSPPDFVDVQRVPLDTGLYSVELTITDHNDTSEHYTVSQDISMNFPSSAVSVSDIELLERYTATKEKNIHTKSGFDVYPFVVGFYPPEVSRLLFYSEIYRTDSAVGSDVLVRYLISKNETKEIVNDLVGMKKCAPARVIPLMAELPIDQLGSGNYQLTVEVRNRENRLLAYRQCFFQRINIVSKPVQESEISLVNTNGTFVTSFDNIDTLKEYVASMFPLLSPLEGQIAERQLQGNDLLALQQFFYYFWSRREGNDPQKAWYDYRLEVLRVNNSYSTRNRKGYETDRGRVYLKYGPPNTMVKEASDPESYPYEIWHYYRVGSQTNRRFVFYSNDLASNNFRLLHSDTRGEVQDPNWELKLHSRSQAFGPDLDQGTSYDIYGSRTKYNFNLPR
ncbi:MAG: GWxTD domain-containing protein [Bacteroidota bacterium]